MYPTTSQSWAINKSRPTSCASVGADFTVQRMTNLANTRARWIKHEIHVSPLCRLYFQKGYVMINALMEQELLTLPDLPSSPVFSGIRVTRFLVLCVYFVDRCLYFFFLASVVSVPLRYTSSDYPFNIFKLFLW